MPRPSRHLDRALLAAGRELLPLHGCSGLTIRQVAEAAGVNIGMFHYHFRTREAFLRAVMQGAYEEMFSQFTLGLAKEASATANLRAAFRVLGRFLQGNRAFITRILADALHGEAVARDFLKDNFPRHLSVLMMLVASGQASGELRPVAPSQAIAFCASAVAMPILAGGAMADASVPGAAFARDLRSEVLTPEALDERIDLALAALAAPAPKTKRKGRAP
jgi:AcrR family transcriptional regulator